MADRARQAGCFTTPTRLVTKHRGTILLIGTMFKPICPGFMVAPGVSSVGMTAQCQRTKNESLGVNTPRSKISNGVSSSGGRARCRIMAAFQGKDVVTTRALGPSVS
jgi:hypothetical protein